MASPTLYVFLISHFCEKARWALDYLGIKYELMYVAPGLHRNIAQKLGAIGSSVPILTSNGNVIQGASEIINWAQAQGPDNQKNLPSTSNTKEGAKIEKRVDDILGVHIRRLYYSEALVEYPETVKPLFLDGIPFLHKIFIWWKWTLIQKLLIKGLDLGSGQFENSRNIIEKELDWLDGLIEGGEGFLSGDRFSRVDLSMASLLAPLALPKEHPTYNNLKLPPRLNQIAEVWSNRPSMRAVLEFYKNYR